MFIHHTTGTFSSFPTLTASRPQYAFPDGPVPGDTGGGCAEAGVGGGRDQPGILLHRPRQEQDSRPGEALEGHSGQDEFSGVC